MSVVEAAPVVVTPQKPDFRRLATEALKHARFKDRAARVEAEKDVAEAMARLAASLETVR